MLSAVLIVKNEKDLLPRCLESIKGIGEIVVVDTGSKDNTVQIAKDFGCKIGHFKWIDDFSKARNYAMSLATGEFVFIIDADEYLITPIKEVKRIVKQHSDKRGMYVKTTAEGSKEQNNSIRIFKRGIKYRGAIHETPQVTTDIYTDIEIVYGSSPAHKLDPDIDMRILKKELDKNPSLVREKYYLAREYFYRNKWQEALNLLDKYVLESEFRGERADGYLMRARCLWQLQKGEEARVSCMYAIMTNPDFKEALLFMAELNYEPRKSKWLEYSSLAKNDGVVFIRTSI